MYQHERSLVKQLADKPFALIGVNSDGDVDYIKKTAREKNLNWRSFWNGPDGTRGPIARAWRIKGWPTIYVIDHQGVIRYQDVRGSSMDEAITTLLAEMGHEVTITHAEDEGGH
ncbi:MAG: TlpA family protein disulfide reductase [Planctomycetaceae bacterium]|nr:TlpA family protein disulfide reductase [Planctomycetaceae bacterium]